MSLWEGLSVQVHFTQSGGFVGLIRRCTIDPATLEPEAAAELQALIREADITGEANIMSPSQRDRILYEIAFTDDRDFTTAFLLFDDATVPPNVLPLLRYLKTRSKKCFPPYHELKKPSES